MNNNRDKFNKLPQDIQDVLSSDIVIDLSDEIIQKFGINDKDISKNSRLITRLLLKDLPLNQLSSEISRVFRFNSQKSKKMAIDVIGKMLLIFDKYFKGQASQYLKLAGVSLQDFQPDIMRQKQAIKKAKEERQAEKAEEASIPSEAEAPVEFVESSDAIEKKDAPEVFKTNLVAFLYPASDELKEIIDDYNGILMILMDKDQTFKRNLEMSLYENQENLTSKKITLVDKQVEPSVANWLKDFIAKNGSNFFDNVILSQYVINSENGKKLNIEEKKLVTKLLSLYRNLKFFPQSLAGIPSEQWQIIPIEIEVTPAVKTPPKLPPQKIVPIQPTPDTSNLTAIERRAMKELNQK